MVHALALGLTDEQMDPFAACPRGAVSQAFDGVAIFHSAVDDDLLAEEMAEVMRVLVELDGDHRSDVAHGDPVKLRETCARRVFPGALIRQPFCHHRVIPY